MYFADLGIVAGRGDISTSTGPVGVNEGARLVEEFVGVGAKVVPLRLNEIGGQHLRAISVKEGEGSGEAGRGNAQEDGIGDHLAPGGLALGDLSAEEVVEEEVVQTVVLLKGRLDVPQEDGANDAPSTPHERNATVVELPVELARSLTQQHEALRVRDDLRGVEGLAICVVQNNENKASFCSENLAYHSNVLNEGLLVALVLGGGWAVEELTRLDTLLFEGGQATGKD